MSYDRKPTDVFGGKVREFRKARGWSVEKLAREAKVTQSYLSQLEAGQRPKPGINIILQIATALRASLDELMGFDPNALPPEKPQADGSIMMMERMNQRMDRMETMVERLLASAETRSADGSGKGAGSSAS